MAQPSTVEANGVSPPESSDYGQPVVAGKRKREESEDAVDEPKESVAPAGWTVGNQKELIKSYFTVLSG
jgi:hypothetical protein